MDLDYRAIIDWLVNQWDIRTIVVLIVLDLVVAVAAAIKVGVFAWRRLAEFMRTMILPYLIVYAAFSMVVWALGGTEWEAAKLAVFAFLVASLLASVGNHLKELGLEIPLPTPGRSP
jgi:membrane protease YdiL (CAAX protease family)